MNKENLDKLIEHLEKVPDAEFDMSNYVSGVLRDLEDDGTPPDLAAALACAVITDHRQGRAHGCGTAACIAGWAFTMAVAEMDENTMKGLSTGEAHGLAMDWLGLTYEDADRLFTPPTAFNYDHITKAQAIQTLENLRETGAVDWTVAGIPIDED